jgi:starvation-inducible DNA-binding protein
MRLAPTEPNEVPKRLVLQKVAFSFERAVDQAGSFSTLSTVKEAEGVPKATEMICQLVDDQAKVVAAVKEVVRAAESAGDDATADLGIRRIQVHEKNSWMLASHLE